MGVLMVRCPNTTQEVSTGIEIEAESFATLPDKLVASQCPLCGFEPVWLKCDARFIKEPSTQELD
jgi:hypothetical protein